MLPHREFGRVGSTLHQGCDRSGTTATTTDGRAGLWTDCSAVVIHQAQHYGAYRRWRGRKGTKRVVTCEELGEQLRGGSGADGIAAFFAKVNDANSFLYQGHATFNCSLQVTGQR